MTTQTNDYQLNLNTGNTIMLDVERQLRQLKMAAKTTESHYTNWQQLTQAPQPALTTTNNDMAPLVGTLLAGFLDLLMGGMPVMQNLAHGIEGAVGVAHAAREDAPRPAPLHKTSKINSQLKTSQAAKYKSATSAQNAQTRQMQMLQQMTMMLMMQMMQQNTTESSDDGESDVVPDVLRDPKMARFKQNRHSISCIRTMFQHQVEMTVPRYQPPRYNFN